MNAINTKTRHECYNIFIKLPGLNVHHESKKTRHQTLGHNFTNYYPIFKIFSLADSAVNVQQIHL